MIELFRSTTFRTTLFFIIFFFLAASVLFTFTYRTAFQEFDETLRERIASESRALSQISRNSGASALRAEIDETLASRRGTAFRYALLSRSGEVLAGNLPAVGVTKGWFALRLIEDPDDEDLTSFLLLGTTIRSGEMLVVGASREQSEDLLDVIFKAFVWGMLPAVLIALAGGLILSRITMTRVSEIGHASLRLVEGNLSGRLELSSSRDEFDRLSASINTMLDRIQQLMQTMQQVTNDIAHDLRTPLGRLRNTLDEACHAPNSSEGFLTTLEGAIAEVDQIMETFDALLRLGEIEAGAARSRFGAVDLSAIVANLIDTYEAVASERNQALVSSVEPDTHVQGEGELLAQMLVNLIENAITHSPDGAIVEISLGASQGRAELTIGDNGPGIPEPLHDKVLEPFYRLEHSRTTAGNGLGLSLVRAIANLHNVELSFADNHPGLLVRLSFAREARRT